jgi:hypothetical protein
MTLHSGNCSSLHKTANVQQALGGLKIYSQSYFSPKRAFDPDFGGRCVINFERILIFTHISYHEALMKHGKE